MGERKIDEVIRKMAGFKQRAAISKIIVFGSFARGKFTEHSDIDLLLVNPKFKGKKFHERTKGLWLQWDLGLPVDFICYTPKEFNALKKRPTIVKEALKEGVVV